VSETTDLFEPRIYDAVYADIVVDIPLLVALMKSAGGRVLEVCCGNGRVLVPALEAGVPADGLDLSAAMLDDLKAKLAARGFTAGVFEGDMRDFSLRDRYALIVIPFNSFFHNLTQADQIGTLSCCRRHLARGGRLAIVAFHPSAPMLIKYGSGDPVPTETAYGEGKLVCWDSAAQDRVEQVQTVNRKLQYFDSAGRLEREETMSFRMRWAYKPEMELLLRVAGFARWEVRAFFTSYREPASAVSGRAPIEGDHLLYTAWNE
jgi:SAM-dependent methyltransferase